MIILKLGCRLFQTVQVNICLRVHAPYTFVLGGEDRLCRQSLAVVIGGLGRLFLGLRAFIFLHRIVQRKAGIGMYEISVLPFGSNAAVYALALCLVHGVP